MMIFMHIEKILEGLCIHIIWTWMDIKIFRKIKCTEKQIKDPILVHELVNKSED